jgi:hypothetical protein
VRRHEAVTAHQEPKVRSGPEPAAEIKADEREQTAAVEHVKRLDHPEDALDRLERLLKSNARFGAPARRWRVLPDADTDVADREPLDEKGDWEEDPSPSESIAPSRRAAIASVLALPVLGAIASLFALDSAQNLLNGHLFAVADDRAAQPSRGDATLELGVVGSPYATDGADRAGGGSRRSMKLPIGPNATASFGAAGGPAAVGQTPPAAIVTGPATVDSAGVSIEAADAESLPAGRTLPASVAESKEALLVPARPAPIPARRAAAVPTNRSIEPVPNNAYGYAAKAMYLIFSNRPREAVDVADAGLSQNPNSSMLYVQRSRAQASLGRFEQAKSDALQALKLEPGGALSIWGLQALGDAELGVENYEAAAQNYRLSRWAGTPDLTLEISLAAAEALVGRMDEAKIALADALRIKPDLTIKWRMDHGSHIPAIFEGLRKAGLSER